MGLKFRTVFAFGIALLVALISPASAGHGPLTGLLQESIASSLPPDAVRASLAGVGVTYGVGYIGEVYDTEEMGRTASGIINLYRGMTDDQIMDLLEKWRRRTSTGSYSQFTFIGVKDH